MSNPTRPDHAAALDKPIEAMLVEIDDDEPTPNPASPTSAAASSCS